MIHLFSEFERRVRTVLLAVDQLSEKISSRRGGRGRGRAASLFGGGRGGVVGEERIIRYDARAGNRAGGPADVLLYDQAVINNVLLSALVGREAHMSTNTNLDMRGSSPPHSFWETPALEWHTPLALGTYEEAYPRRYARRERTLTRGTGADRIAETLMMAPPWLFSAESDSRVPPVSREAVQPRTAAGGVAGGGAAPLSETTPVRLAERDRRSRLVHVGRPAAKWWAQNPPPAVLVHFVCAAWPGSGGRVMAMELWGKWFYRDIDAQLGTHTFHANRSAALPPRGAPSADGLSNPSEGPVGGTSSSSSQPPPPLGFDANSWLRVCGVACAVKRCTLHGGWNGEKPPQLQTCTTWLNKASWSTSPLAEISRASTGGGSAEVARASEMSERGRPAASTTHRELGKLRRREHTPKAKSGGAKANGGGADGGKAAKTAKAGRAGGTAKSAFKALTRTYGRRLWGEQPHPGSSSTLSTIEQRVAGIVEAQVVIPPALAAASHAAATTHVSGLIAFATPIAAADRREYQIYVHILMSAAMLTQRKPVLPLALCAAVGEWSSKSRCIYVLHAALPKQAEYCVQRPPSPCHGKVALPNELEGLAEADVGTVTLPRLPLVNGSVNVEALGVALGAQARERRALLLDTSALTTADDLSNLLVTPKGWLCTLEHKSCQNAC